MTSATVSEQVLVNEPANNLRKYIQSPINNGIYHSNHLPSEEVLLKLEARSIVKIIS